MPDGHPIAISAAPRDAKDIEAWLRQYPSWVEDLQAAGYYNVPSDLGTRVQSNREGRPTERAAILLASLAERVRIVESWLSELSPLERRLADHYIAGLKITQVQGELDYMTARGLVQGLPHVIWSRYACSF